MTVYSRTEIAGLAQRAAAQSGVEAENPFPEHTAAHAAFAESLEFYLLAQVGVEQGA